ncbi:uncharacterized protein LOC144446056 isoform X2 [Glandiceps talaboti]
MASDTSTPNGVRRRVDIWSTARQNYSTGSPHRMSPPSQVKTKEETVEVKNVRETEKTDKGNVEEVKGGGCDSKVDEKQSGLSNKSPTSSTIQKPIYAYTKSRSTTYASTKTVAQGFLNMSLLSANAGQLKQVLKQGSEGDFFYMLLVMIILSMILQLSVSILLALKPLAIKT